MTGETPVANRRVWLVAIFLFIVGDGLTLQTRGPLLRSFEADFGVSEALLGLVAPAGTIGFVVAVLVVGFLAGRVDITRWLLVGVGITAISLLLAAGAPVYWLLLLFILGQGTATGIVRGLDRPILSHLYPDQRARMFTLHSLAWSVGALFGPIFVNWVLAVTSWRVTFLLLGTFFMPLFVLLARIELPAAVEAERDLSVAAFGRLVRDPVILAMIAAITLVGAFEGIIFTWLPFYASSFIPMDRANLLLSAYLMAYIPGRICYSWLVDRISALVLVVVLCTAAVPAVAVMVSGVTGPLLYASVLLAGFFASGMFPLISAFGIERAPEYTGPISAMGTGGAYVGLAIGPLIIGAAAEVTGIAAAMGITVFVAVGLTITVLLMWVLDRLTVRRDRQSSPTAGD